MTNFVYDKSVGASRHFIGRQKQLRNILQQILHSRDVILCGGPKTGKTSMLEQLVMMLKELPKNTEGQEKICPIYVDLYSIYDKRVNVFLDRLWNILCDEFNALGTINQSAEIPGKEISIIQGMVQNLRLTYH